MRITPAIALSALLIGSLGYGRSITIDSGQTITETANNETIESIQLTGNGNLTLTSTGTSTISKMQMYWLTDGASATFNVNNGSLNLNLGMNNPESARNNIAFNVGGGSTLTLTAGAQNGKKGVFQGSNTNLTANIAGTLSGGLSNNGTSNITISGTMSGDLMQTGGTLKATVNGKLEGSITSAQGVAKTSLWSDENATNSTITGNISIEGGQLEGILKRLTLQGNYTQTGGTSDIAFHRSKFESATVLSNAQTTIHFYSSEIKSISATNGRTTINHIASSKMEDYTGIGGKANLNLNGGSVMKSASQTGGTLTLKAQSSKIDGSITGSDATLNILLNQGGQFGKTTISGSITNSNGSTEIRANNTSITGSVSQTGGFLDALIDNTTFGGSITQSGGVLTQLGAIKTTIAEGIILTKVGNKLYYPQISLKETTITSGGIQITNATGDINGEITQKSVINGGYDQTGRAQVSFTFKDSTLKDGIKVRDGGGVQGNPEQHQGYATILKFQNESTLEGGVTSDDHSLWLTFSESKANGNITSTNGDLNIRAFNKSTITGDLVSNQNRETHLHLEDETTFKGNITQDEGHQHLQALGDSKIIGDIKNTNTNVDFELRSNSELEGSYTQDNGSLNWTLGGKAIVHKDIILNKVETTLGNGNATDHLETFKGDFTQNGGSLFGTLGGLTLEGKFTQNGGTSDITFKKADFKKPITINNADLTNITFDDSSKLKTTTITNSKNANNSFILDHTTILDGDFILEHSKVTLGVKNGSKITGSIKSDDEDNDLKLDFEGEGNEIGGDIEVKNGNLNGDISGTTVGGKLTLTDVETHLHIVKSTIKGGIDITRGHTLLTIDGSTINKGFKMIGVDKKGKSPTLGLSFSNASTIDGDLSFEDTDVAFGGFGEGNTIAGNLISTNSTLITGGDDFAQAGHEPKPDSVSGLTINGELKQENGTLDLTFSNGSNIKGKTTLSKGGKSHLTLIGSKMGKLEVIEGKDNLITLKDGSEQNGDTTLTSTTATIQAFGGSKITGDITAKAEAPITPNTTIKLDNSVLLGNITQTNGNLTLDYSNRSSMTGDLTLDGLELFHATLSQSSITGNFNITKSTVDISMKQGSSISGDLNLTGNPKFTLNSSASTLKGAIIHTETAGGETEIQLNFKDGSTLNNTKTTITGDMFINSSNSTINSEEGMTLAIGSLKLFLDQSNGTIKSITTGASNTVTILTNNRSNSTIDLIEMSDTSTLSLTGQNSAILSGEVKLKNTSTANITSLSNANLKINITPENTTTLNLTLNGGILEGTIKQEPLASTGTMTLGSSGNYGGRWIATDSSSIKTLNIINSSANIANEGLMFKDTYDTPISLVDTTRSVNGSRIGMAMIKEGIAEENQTLQRMIRTGRLEGANGVFRVYTDIGAQASDQISAQSAEGKHIMQVYYNPATFTEDIGDRYIVVAHVDDAQTTASFEGGSTLIGTQVYQTSLTKVNAQNGNGFDWILGKTQNAGANYGTKIISSILQSQYRSFALQTETFRQRMGDLRDINRVHGLWGRYNMGTTATPESEAAVEIEDDFYTAWVGYDQNVLDLRGQDFFGFALSYNLVSPKGEDYSGSIHSIGFNFYNTFIARNDFYVDLVVKYILSIAEYEISYYSLAKNTPSYFSHKLMLNAEIGKRFKLSERKNYFFLQPEAQITAGYIFGNEVDFVDFTQTTIHATIKGTAPVILRTGLTAGYSLNQGIKSDFYVGTSLFYETTNGGTVRLDDGNNVVHYSHKGSFKMSVQGGFDMLFTDNARVYFEAGTSFLGKTNTTYSINAGARFSFGYKNTRKLIVPSSITPPPPPQEPYDPRNIPVITDYTSEDIRNNNSAKPKMRGGGDDYFINTRKAYRDKTTVQKTIRSR